MKSYRRYSLKRLHGKPSLIRKIKKKRRVRRTRTRRRKRRRSPQKTCEST
jgi:hypothetical protein